MPLRPFRPTKEMVSVSESAAILGISRGRVHQLIGLGRLTVVGTEKPFPGGPRKWLKRSEVEARAIRRAAEEKAKEDRVAKSG